GADRRALPRWRASRPFPRRQARPCRWRPCGHPARAVHARALRPPGRRCRERDGGRRLRGRPGHPAGSDANRIRHVRCGPRDGFAGRPRRQAVPVGGHFGALTPREPTTMEIERIRALRGPNRWSSRTAIEATVRCAPAETSLRRMPGIESRISERFPAIGPLPAYPEQPDLGLPQLLGIAALGLQAEAGCPVSFSRTAPTRDPGIFHVVVEYTEEAVGREAMEFAATLCAAARDDLPFDVAGALARLRELDEDLRLGPSTGAIVAAAVARGIPYRRLTDGSLVQFGWGSRQRRIQAAETDRSGAIAEAIAQD